MLHWRKTLIIVLIVALGLPASAQLADGDSPILRATRLDESLMGDLPEILERGRLRVLVAYNQTGYFIDQGRPRGVAYEALRRFGERLNQDRKRPIDVVFVPTPRVRLLRDLVAGLGDIAAGNLTVTEARRTIVDFSRPILTGVREVIVTGPEGPKLKTMADLAGARVFVTAGTSYVASLENLAANQKRVGADPVSIGEVAPELEDEDLLQMVNSGLLPTTLVDDHIARLWSRVLPNLRVHEELALRTGGEIAWAVRPETPQLLAALDEFVTETPGRSTLGAVLHHRYLESAHWAEAALAPLDRSRFEALDEFFRSFGDRYDLDWLLLAAQGYQESRLDQSARSASGAVGVMQILPSTASAPPVSIEGVSESAEQNIHAGARYMRVILDRYLDDPELPELDRHLLALASYNAGPTRLRRLRKEAAERGFDPNRWFGEMEVVVGERVGREPVLYVANIYKYYVGYKLAEERVRSRIPFKKSLAAP